MEKELRFNNSFVLADKITRLRDSQLETVPRAVTTIIDLLQKGNLQSARDTFRWEMDKIMQNKELYDLLKKELLGE